MRISRSNFILPSITLFLAVLSPTCIQSAEEAPIENENQVREEDAHHALRVLALLASGLVVSKNLTAVSAGERTGSFIEKYYTSGMAGLGTLLIWGATLMKAPSKLESNWKDTIYGTGVVLIWVALQIEFEDVDLFPFLRK